MNSKALFLTKDNHACKEIIRSTGSTPFASIVCKTKSSSSSKTRSYNLFIANTGLFFIRTSLGHTPSLSRFISIVDINSVQRIQKDNYLILYGNNCKEIEAQHFDIIIEKIAEIRSILEYNSPFDKPIVFEGMKGVQIEKKKSAPPNLLAIRLRAIATKYNINSAELDSIRTVFDNFETTPRTYIYFPETIKYLDNFKLFGYPLLPERFLSIVRFNGTGPLLICKLLRYLMKYMKSLRTVILENYNSFKIEQLGLDSLKNPSVISWTFNNIFSGNPRELPKLIKSFENYDGDIQTLNLINVEINEKDSLEIASTISNAHCFKSLEVFSANSIKTPEEETYKVYYSLISSLSKLPMIHSTFFDNWVNPIIILTLERKYSYSFLKNNIIRSILIGHANFASVKSSFIFPPTVTNIQFPHAIMSSSSLNALLKSIQKMNKDNITLSLDHISLKKKSWDSFYKDSSKLLPLNNLIEIDWTGNPLPDSFIPEFNRIFLSNPNLKFVSIGEVFGDETADSLLKIINYLSKFRIWGLDIHGNQELNFKKRIVEVLRCVAKLPSLEHLNISSQYLTDDSIRELFVILKSSLKIIHEISIDDAQFSNINSFYGAYAQLATVLKLESIQKPLIDVSKNVSEEESKTERYLKFKLIFKMTKRPSTRFERVCFYQNSLDLTSSFFEFFKNFSISAYHTFERDNSGFSEVEQQNGYARSLFDKEYKPIIGNFSYEQNFLLTSPFETPTYKPTTDFVLSKSVKNCRSFAENIKEEEQIDEKKEDKVNVDDILNQYSSLIRPTFLHVLSNIQILSKIFNGVEDEKDEIST